VNDLPRDAIRPDLLTSSAVQVLVMTRPRLLIIAGGLLFVLGTFVPWAQIGPGPQFRSLINASFSLSVTAIDIDSWYGWLIVCAGVVAIAAAVRLAMIRGHSPVASVVAAVAGVVGGLLGVMTAGKAQNGSRSFEWVGSLIDTSSLLTVSVGAGAWLVVVGAILAVTGGLLAYSGR
jgi:hypothetical protein